LIDENIFSSGITLSTWSHEVNIVQAMKSGKEVNLGVLFALKEAQRLFPVFLDRNEVAGGLPLFFWERQSITINRMWIGQAVVCRVGTGV